MLSFLIACLVVAGCLYWRRSTQHPEGFPPGPNFPIPILGDMLSFKGNLVDGVIAFKEKYGDIFGMWVGPRRTVFINEIHMIQV